MNAITEKQRKTREKYSKENTNEKFLFWMFTFLIVSSFFAFKGSVTKATNSTADITAMIAPTQNNLSVIIPYSQKINGVNTVITQFAEYQISGRVVESYDYTGSMAGVMKAISGKEYYNDISCADVAIAYGPMALTENHKRMDYRMSGSRKILYAIKDPSLKQDVGDLEVIGRYITNNHLIASNSEVEKLIKQIDNGDFVQISGYLVSISWEKGIYHYDLTSSLSRDDVGNGACEVILVENVKWIK